MILVDKLNLKPWADKAGVYILRNKLNGKCYVGSAWNSNRRSIAIRFKEHLRNLRRGSHSNPHLQRAWTKYGEDAFELGVLEVVENNYQLNDRERYWIENLQAVEQGYNIARDPVAFMRGVTFSEEHKAKIGEATKARMNLPEQKDKYRQLATERMSKPEYKAIQLETLKKLWASPEYCERMSTMFKNREVSEETCRKISESKKGKPNLKLRGRKMSAETKAKLSTAKKGQPSAFKGRHHSEETKAKIADLHRGNKYCVDRILSEETKQRISQAHMGKKLSVEHRRTLRMKSPRVGQFKGVSYNKRMGKYKAAYNSEGEVFLGWFSDSAEAAANYDYHVLRAYGRGECYLNFPDRDYSNFIPKRQL